MKLTQRKKRRIAILAAVLLILLAAFLSLWLTGVLHYWNHGMTALMNETGNYGYTTQKIENTNTVQLDLSLPEKNLGLILFEDGNARLVVENYWFEKAVISNWAFDATEIMILIILFTICRNLHRKSGSYPLKIKRQPLTAPAKDRLIIITIM